MSSIPTHYNQMSFKHRLQSSAKLLSRARKQGGRQVITMVLRDQPLLHLGRRPDLDGLSLYRQAVAKLVIPPQIGQGDGRTILLVSHC